MTPAHVFTAMTAPIAMKAFLPPGGQDTLAPTCFSPCMSDVLVLPLFTPRIHRSFSFKSRWRPGILFHLPPPLAPHRDVGLCCCGSVSLALGRAPRARCWFDGAGPRRTVHRGSADSAGWWDWCVGWCECPDPSPCPSVVVGLAGGWRYAPRWLSAGAVSTSSS